MIMTMMIHSFSCSDTEALFKGHCVERFQNIGCIARRKLKMLKVARTLQDLEVAPRNRLELLKGGQKN
jgi:proteic killer suppression protein